MKSLLSRFWPASWLLLTAALCGCAPGTAPTGPTGSAPTLRFERATPPLRQSATALHTVRWVASDAGVSVDHYRVAVNPVSLDASDPAWRSTRDRVHVLRAPLAPARQAPARRDPFDVIAVQAVTRRGAASLPIQRVFFGDNIAPSVVIRDPQPSSLIQYNVSDAVEIQWEGVDPDGENEQPAFYKSLLLGENGPFPLDVAITNPDSLRRFYAPAFEGWEKHKGKDTQTILKGLEPGRRYVWVITAFDEDGAYDPVFSFNSNMLRMRATAGSYGPTILLLPTYEFVPPPPDGVYSFEVPANQPATFHWRGAALPGTGEVEYRWVIDPESTDEKELEKSNEWTKWGADKTSAAIDASRTPGRRLLLIEARDAFDHRARATVHVDQVAGTFDRPLLVVDDTRFLGDQYAAGCAQPPVGAWPTAAELDTFLFARGGFPWRCYPAGIVSPPGLFAGYEFDTLGTRTGQADLTVRLETLLRYQNVIWITDAKGALNTAPGTDHVAPMTALRYMSSPGRVNTLAQYAQAGGNVWTLGGGIGAASTLPWNRTANDIGGITFSNAQQELVSGRFMYDAVHWRSEFKVVTVGGFVVRYLGREPTGGPPYALLPPQMRLKTTGLDPFPPNRTGQSPSVFYKTAIDVEFLSFINFIIEEPEGSALDSLYEFISFSLPPTTARRVCMTYYHGAENRPLMFSGFDTWSFTRDDCQALVDFVLQGAWGLSRQPVAGGLAQLKRPHRLPPSPPPSD